MCMVRGSCLAWKRMDQDYDVKIKRKEVSGGMRSILSVPSDSLLQQDFSAAATARQVTDSPSPPCPLYGWRSPPPSRSPLSCSAGILYISRSPQRTRCCNRLGPRSCPAPPQLRLDPKIKSRQKAGEEHFVDAP